MKSPLIFFFYILTLSSIARADPVPGLEGKWTGQCKRGATTVNSSVVLDQSSGYLNGKPIANLKKDKNNVTFNEADRGFVFRGSFSPNTINLTGSISKPDTTKVADCNYTKVTGSSTKFCIRNIDGITFYFRTVDRNGKNPSVLETVPPEREVTGDPQGKICWDTQQFGPDECKRSLPLNTYGCNR